jgi:hypothetical protein
VQRVEVNDEQAVAMVVLDGGDEIPHFVEKEDVEVVFVRVEEKFAWLSLMKKFCDNSMT